MKFYCHPTPEAGRIFVDACRSALQYAGFTEVPYAEWADIAIAPWLTRKLSRDEYQAPRFGTLVFHPSALPYRRGPDAIRHTVAAGERVSAATWFWCDDGWDTGDICEQETVVLKAGEGPREAYVRFLAPAVTALKRAASGVMAAAPRRVRQDAELSTYDRAIPRQAHGA